jgi:hypothetical protein
MEYYKMDQDINMHEYIEQHCIESMNNALAAFKYTTWERKCPNFSDVEFVSKGLLRCITPVDSGRHFIQNIQEQFNSNFPHSTYFTALHSSRRRDMLKAVALESYKIVCNLADELEINYLNHFSELDDYEIEAADGHFVKHACHTPKNPKGRVFAAGFIYAMNLRNGFLNPICKVTNGTKRSHEIPCFRSWVENEYSKKKTGLKKLYIYDRASVDYAWWDKQKKNDVYIISLLKENAVINFIKTLDFDKNDPVNAGVVSYELYSKRKETFTVVTYKDPETDKVYKFISTLQISFRPGIIAILYYKRWTIEKAFNNTKSDLKEKKAWSSDDIPHDIQMRLTAMTYNLMRLFEEKTKRIDENLIHPAEIKYKKKLIQRDKIAKTKGKFVNKIHFMKRIARISSSTIRTFNNAITTKMPLKEFIKKLVAKLIVRPIIN